MEGLRSRNTFLVSGKWAGEGKGRRCWRKGADAAALTAESHALLLGGASSVTQSTEQQTGNHPAAEWNTAPADTMQPRYTFKSCTTDCRFKQASTGNQRRYNKTDDSSGAAKSAAAGREVCSSRNTAKPDTVQAGFIK